MQMLKKNSVTVPIQAKKAFTFDEYCFKLMDYFGGDIASQSEEQLLNAMTLLDKDYLSEQEMKLIIQTAQQMDANP